MRYICRRAWAEASVCGDVEFDLDAELIDFRAEANFQEAKNLYDEAKSKAGKSGSNGYGKGSSAMEKECFSCGKEGHLASSCWTKSGVLGCGVAVCS